MVRRKNRKKEKRKRGGGEEEIEGGGERKKRKGYLRDPVIRKIPLIFILGSTLKNWGGEGEEGRS